MQINNEAETQVIKKKISKTQKDWIPHFNAKGEKMISAPDLYNLAKENNKEILKSIQEDFEEYVVTSTRINYMKDSLDAEIIHDFGSTVVKPKSINVKVPVYVGEKTREYSFHLFSGRNCFSCLNNSSVFTVPDTEIVFCSVSIVRIMCLFI